MGDKLKILVVDDEPETVEMLKVALERGNYNVVAAYDGKEGIEKARSEKPALIVLDIMMPRMNGVEACKIMKSDTELASIPVIMLTAMASQIPTSSYSMHDGMEIEADDYIEKPVDPNLLLARVNAMLEK